MFPTQECATWSFCCSTTLPANDIASVLDFSQFQRYVVLSHYYSTWIPQWQTCWASFHILLSHLRIFFGKMSTQIFVCAYFNWVVFLLLNKEIFYKRTGFCSDLHNILEKRLYINLIISPRSANTEPTKNYLILWFYIFFKKAVHTMKSISNTSLLQRNNQRYIHETNAL